MSYDSCVITIVGCDGSRWIVHGPGAGAQGVALGEQPSGLYESPRTVLWSEGANQTGATPRGSRRPPRDIAATFHHYGATSAAMREVASRFRRAWSFDDDTIWEITTPSGTRRLATRLNAEPDTQPVHDPNVTGYVGKILMLRAGDPDYVGTVLTDAWSFDGMTYTGDVTVANPGDQEMWLHWSLKAPASFILPDYSFETRPAHPDYAHRDRLVLLPHMRWHADPDKRQDVLIQTGRGELQAVATDGHQVLARMGGQRFGFAIPPGTPPTVLPVAINPLPWLSDLRRTFNLPSTISPRALYALAEALTGILAPLGQDTVLAMTPQDLVDRIDTAIDAVTPDLIEPWIDAIRTALRLPTAGELITTAYGSVANMAGATAKVYCRPLYKHPWEELI